MQTDRVGAYELVQPLGFDGMAETFIAVRRGLAGFEQRVYLKCIPPGATVDPAYVELFLDEARLLSRINCPNIVQAYEFGEVSGTYYMALELIEGCDLETLLSAEHGDTGGLSSELAGYIGIELLSALSYAHALTIDDHPQHLVHRDVTPANVLLSANGEVKLTEFGITKAHGRIHRTTSEQTKGKLAYMSPEQIRGEHVDARSDLFSAGVVLYEMFADEHPFEAASDEVLIDNIVNGRRTPLCDIVPTLPAEVCALIDALLAVTPDERPVSADDALARLRAAIGSIATPRVLGELVRHVAAIAPVRDGGAVSVFPSVHPSLRLLERARESITPRSVPARAAKATTIGQRTGRGLSPIALAAGAAVAAAVAVCATLVFSDRSSLNDMTAAEIDGTSPTRPAGVVTEEIPEAPIDAPPMSPGLSGQVPTTAQFEHDAIQPSDESPTNPASSAHDAGPRMQGDAGPQPE